MPKDEWRGCVAARTVPLFVCAKLCLRRAFSPALACARAMRVLFRAPRRRALVAFRDASGQRKVP